MTPHATVPLRTPAERDKRSARDFRAKGHAYALTLLEVGIVFELDQLRRVHGGELVGELSVKCFSRSCASAS
jgi:hypothetical protein